MCLKVSITFKILIVIYVLGRRYNLQKIDKQYCYRNLKKDGAGFKFSSGGGYQFKRETHRVPSGEAESTIELKEGEFLR